MNKRACFYMLGSDTKKINDYNILFLSELNKVADYVEVLCPENMDITERNKVASVSDQQVSDDLITRLLLKWNNGITEYNEFILCDSSFMGPLYPFAEMFDKMQESKAWNILRLEESFVDGCCVLSKEVVSYIAKEKASIDQEVRIMDYIEKQGYSVDSYIDLSSYYQLTQRPLLYYSEEIVVQQRCPVFDYKIFYADYFDVLENGDGRGIRSFYEYLKKQELFDVNILWNKLLQDVNQADFARCMNLNYILSGSEVNGYVEEEKNEKIALVMHVYYDELISKTLQYACSVPTTADVYITTDTIEKKKKILDMCDVLQPRKCYIRLIPNRGRDISSLLVGVKDVIDQYDYVCFVHDKKVTQIKQGAIGEGFAARVFDNTLGSKTFVQNVIKLFRDNERLGLLSPAPPNHGDYFALLGQEWGVNYNCTYELAQRLNLQVPINLDKPPIAPFGTCFWFRAKALKPLYDQDWNYEDFPEEPNGTDGTILHAIERIYPLVVQEAGYYPAYVLEKKYAQLDITSFQFYIHNYNSILLNYGYGGKVHEMCLQMQKNLDGEDAPLTGLLDSYKEANDKVSREWKKTADALVRQTEDTLRYKTAFDNANNEWKKTAEALAEVQKSNEIINEEWKKTADGLAQIQEAHERVNEEWKKTAEALKECQHAYNELMRKYRNTIRGQIERFMNAIGGKNK